MGTKMVVTFKDFIPPEKDEFRGANTVCLYDPIDLIEEQKNFILHIASQRTRQDFKNTEEGIDLAPDLSKDQKNDVLDIKDEIIGDFSAEELEDSEIVTLTKHALDRLVLYLGNRSKPDILKIIQRVIDADFVLKAQYKGKTELTYTLQNRPKKEKTVISFKGHELEEGFEISVVTLTLENVKKDLMQPLFSEDLREQMLKIANTKQNNND